MLLLEPVLPWRFRSRSKGPYDPVCCIAHPVPTLPQHGNPFCIQLISFAEQFLFVECCVEGVSALVAEEVAAVVIAADLY